MEVLRRKLLALAKGEEGVALVVTLAFFMLMYVSCAGVFAIGHAVKEKVILQNAVDAAAYSAAVVQADALSRIATINRAMAWTYKDMVSRQMDYVVLKWLEKTDSEYRKLDSLAKRRCFVPSLADNGSVGLKGERVTIGEMRDALSEFDDGSLRAAIDRDRDRIAAMGEAVRILAGSMREKMEDAARDALEANLPGDIGDRCLFKVKTPHPDLLKPLLDEDRFLEFADLSGDFASWFPLSSDEEGLSRSWIDMAGRIWSSFVWYDHADMEHPPVVVDAHNLRDGYYYGTRARPLVLSKEYFDDGGVARGAVTVGVAKQNANPWTGYVDTNGFYSAFTHSDAAKWTWAVSSAQAGYRPEMSGLGCDYSTGWEEWEDGGQSWNLCTDDWDAVFVPVRNAFSSEEFKGFIAEPDGDSGAWERLASSPSPEFDLTGYGSDISRRAALPRMHNDRATRNLLDFGADFLDLMYH